MFRPSVVPLLLILSQLIIHYKSFSVSNPSFWYCPDHGSIPAGSAYLSNVNQLLQTLPSKAENNNGYYNDSVGTSRNQAYGLIMCYADASPENCNSCLVGVNSDNTCDNSGEASKHYDSCFVRFANYSFFSSALNWLPLCMQNSPSVSVPNFLNSPSVQLLINNLTTEASYSTYRYATGETTYESNQTLQMLLQCTRDLPPSECRNCINQYISIISEKGANCSDWQGARVMGPSCYVRYELYSFDVVKPPGPTTSNSNKSGLNSKLIVAIAISSMVVFLLLGTIIVCMLRRRRTKSQTSSDMDLELDTAHLKDYMNSSMEVFSDPISESKLFELSLLKDATGDFSSINLLGEGGFGQVYKGTFPDGQEVAVKRLAKGSMQGLKELKNEVDLLWKLKHRNLVQVLGCCLQEKEKLLCYEYLPNGSLDNILFDQKDASKRLRLDWATRHKIIEGISRGLLYLHVESPMKIIHRDLKASNILLDRNMSPKISDFGLARFFKDDQTHKDTSIIAGTFGYMAPEYVMQGNFSAKSDVYSFGVLILEIVMGRKNSSFSDPKLSSSIIAHSSKLWRSGSLNLLKDPALNEDCLGEIIRCVHIALLCVQENPIDRPDMEMVTLMLRDNSVNVPTLYSAWSDISVTKEDLMTETR